MAGAEKLDITIENEEHAIPQPGRILREARLALGLDIEIVAERLKITKARVEALERDEYDLVSGPTFLRGYIRRYAEMLDLSPAPLIMAYEHYNPEGAPPLMKNGKAVRSELGKGFNLPGSPLFWLLLATLGMAVVLLGRNDISMEFFKQLDLANVLENEPVITTEQNSKPAEPKKSKVFLESIPQKQQTNLAKKAELELNLKATSWVEVKDAQGRRHMYGMYERGSSHIIVGGAPFKVTLGKTEQVELIYNGEVILLEEMANDEGVSYFNIGGNE